MHRGWTIRWLFVLNRQQRFGHHTIMHSGRSLCHSPTSCRKPKSNSPVESSSVCYGSLTFAAYTTPGRLRCSCVRAFENVSLVSFSQCIALLRRLGVLFEFTWWCAGFVVLLWWPVCDVLVCLCFVRFWFLTSFLWVTRHNLASLFSSLLSFSCEVAFICEGLVFSVLGFECRLCQVFGLALVAAWPWAVSMASILCACTQRSFFSDCPCFWCFHFTWEAPAMCCCDRLCMMCSTACYVAGPPACNISPPH